MFGLAAVLFFSVTGITLNHPDWFFGEARAQRPVRGPDRPEWLHLDAPTSAAAGEPPIRRARSRSWRSSSTCGRPTASAAPWPTSGSTRPSASVTLQGPGLRGRRLHRPRDGPLHADPDVPRLRRRHQRPAQGPRHRPGLVGRHRRLGRRADGHLADGPGPALLPQAPPRARELVVAVVGPDRRPGALLAGSALNEGLPGGEPWERSDSVGPRVLAVVRGVHGLRSCRVAAR